MYVYGAFTTFNETHAGACICIYDSIYALEKENFLITCQKPEGPIISNSWEALKRA